MQSLKFGKKLEGELGRSSKDESRAQKKNSMSIYNRQPLLLAFIYKFSSYTRFSYS